MGMICGVLLNTANLNLPGPPWWPAGYKLTDDTGCDANVVESTQIKQTQHWIITRNRRAAHASRIETSHKIPKQTTPTPANHKRTHAHVL